MSRTSARPDPMATAIDEAELMRSLSELITPVISIPEGERAAFYRSMERLSRERREDAIVPVTRLAGLWLRVAHLCWPDWPRQTKETR